jgi:hypothetical protein
MMDNGHDIDEVIKELESWGIDSRISKEQYVKIGVGDILEQVLTKFGITEERFKKWFSLQNCNCGKRKSWLNNFFSWQRIKF